MEVRSCKHWCSGKKCITYSDYVFVALGIQHAMHKRRVTVCGLPALRYFPTSFHKWHDLEKKSD
jgi:hypothetical protein